MALKATDVFVPGSYPEHTYVERTADRLEVLLKDALDTKGQIVSLIGPSKSGKTVLVERVVGRDQLITISGAGIRSPDQLWDAVLDWMEAPHSAETTTRVDAGSSVGVEGKGQVAVPFVAKGEAGGNVEVTADVGADFARRRDRRGMRQVVDEIGGSDFVVLVDDFHYMSRSIQEDVAKGLKEAVRLNVRIATAAVVHRGDDVVRALPELRGRVRAIDLEYWRDEELREIARRGFELLNVSLPDKIIEEFVRESAGSPQLMQSLCLQACFVLDIRKAKLSLFRESPEVTDEQRRRIYEQTSASTDSRSLVDVLEAGPKARGTERKTYTFTDGSGGDVYRCVLKAIAMDPPKLSLPYDELLARTVQICKGDSPVGSSVTSTCQQMAKIASDTFPKERAIDWDEQKQILDIPDPYLLFYLRWSGRLREDE